MIDTTKTRGGTEGVASVAVMDVGGSGYPRVVRVLPARQPTPRLWEDVWKRITIAVIAESPAPTYGRCPDLALNALGDIIEVEGGT